MPNVCGFQGCRSAATYVDCCLGVPLCDGHLEKLRRAKFGDIGRGSVIWEERFWAKCGVLTTGNPTATEARE